MMNIVDGMDDKSLEVFEIAEAYAKENLSASVEPAHVLKALLHKDIGLVSFIEKTLDADYYYLQDWADVRIKMCKKNTNRANTPSLSAGTKAVVHEADSVRRTLQLESIDPISLLVAIVTPGVGFTFEQLKTLSLQKEDILAACNQKNVSTKPTNVSVVKRAKGTKQVDTYCLLLNQEQAEGKLAEAIGFENELGEIYGILSRKTKANILITGESGVGKTALIHAFVQAISQNTVPSYLQNALVYELDPIALSIGVSYKSEIEGRMKKVLDELAEMENAILVIESFDQMMDKQGTLYGIVNLLKAYLKRGLLCICTASVEGFTKHIEPDKEMTGKFEHILLEEPTVDQTLEILQTVVLPYETFHGLKISDDFLVNSIRLAKRYFSEKHLPESAIDLIDRTMALLKINNDLHPEQKRETAGVEDLMEVVSQKTGIPLGNVQAAERDRLVNAEAILKKRVVGQDHAIRAVLDAIYESRSGLNKKGQPIGSFFFLGPTGTGKTELAKSLAEFLFQDDTAILRFDMSEYKEEHSVALLYGAPPGYVGYEEGGLLVNQIRQKPYSIVLFDEIEKAHRSVFDLFLQILDEGKLHDRLGRVGDFSNALIIFTSNIGSQYIFDQFAQQRVPTHNDMLEVMQGHFRPEFLARLTEIVPFAPINEQIVTMIFKIHLRGLLKTLEEQHISLVVDDRAMHQIAMSGFNAQYGARPILGILRKDIRRPLSKMIISGELQEGDGVTLTLDDHEQLTWNITHQA